MIKCVQGPVCIETLTLSGTDKHVVARAPLAVFHTSYNQSIHNLCE